MSQPTPQKKAPELGPLQEFMADPGVSDILVNGPHSVYVERQGRLLKTAVRFRDEAHLLRTIKEMAAWAGRHLDRHSPMVDARLPDGSRMNAIIPPLVLGGPALSIRKFPANRLQMADLIVQGSLTPASARFLQAVVQARLNLLISGGTGSGKTTLLNLLSSFIPSHERIVSIEDAAELDLRQDHVVRLETRPPDAQGRDEVTIRDLLRNALRMRPDRIIVGEVRGAEAMDMLQALNTGHDGGLATIHANSPRDALARLETMICMSGLDIPEKTLRQQISRALHLVVQTARLADGSRRVTSIQEITGMEGTVITMQEIFRFQPAGRDQEGRVLGSLSPCGLMPKCARMVRDSGIDLDPACFQAS